MRAGLIKLWVIREAASSCLACCLYLTVSRVHSLSFPARGDGGPATNAQMVTPLGIIVDTATGDVYVSVRLCRELSRVGRARSLLLDQDASSCVIRVIYFANGTIDTVAGNGTCMFSGDGKRLCVWAST